MYLRMFIFAGFLLLQACATTATLVAENTYLASDKTFTLKMEPGWQIGTFTKKKTAMALEKGDVILVAYTIRANGISDEKFIDFSEAMAENFAKEVNGGEYSQSKLLTTPSGGLRYVETTGDAQFNGTSLLYTTFMIAGNNNVYAIMIMGPDESYIKNQGMVGKIPANFREM